MVLRVLASAALLISLLGFSSTGLANADVACKEAGCLVEGWDILDMRSRMRSELLCNNADCQQFGWVFRAQNGQETYTECTGGQCFKEGWKTFDSRSGVLIHTAVCNEPADEKAERNCLSHGWTVRNRSFAPIYSDCVEFDCRSKGWEIRVPGRRTQVVRCKTGGCFEKGWFQFD